MHIQTLSEMSRNYEKNKNRNRDKFLRTSNLFNISRAKEKKLSKRANESYIVNDESTTTSEQASQYQLAKTLAQTAGDIKANI